MYRRSFTREKLIDEVESRLEDFFSRKQIEKVVNSAMDSICEAYARGDSVNFGLGKTFINVRKNNNQYGAVRPVSFVFRGRINSENQDRILKELNSNSKLYETFKSKSVESD